LTTDRIYRREIIGSASRLLMAALTIGSFAAFGWVATDAVRSADGLMPVRWEPLAGAFVLHLIMLFALMLLWVRVLSAGWTPDAGSPAPPRPRLYAAYSRSWLARYIPGRICSLAGRALLASRAGVPAEAAARSMVIEVVFTYSAITILSVALLSGTKIHLFLGVAVLISGFAVFVAGLLVLRGIMTADRANTEPCSLWRRALRWADRFITGGSAHSFSDILGGVCLYGLYAGMHLSLIVLVAAAFADLDISLAATLAGAWGLSVTLGWMSFLAPAGLGVRDGLAFALFSQVLDPATAGIVVMSSRILMLATDVVFVGATELLTLGLTQIARREAVQPGLDPRLTGHSDHPPSL